MGGGRIWLLIGALVGAVVIVVGWFIGASPLFTQAATADTQRADVESTNAQLEVTLAGMKKLDDQKDDLLERLDELHETSPTVPDVEDYLDWVASAAAASAVSVPSTTIGAPQLVQGADGATVQFSPGLSKSLYLIPVTLEIGGNADQMNAFVQLLQNDGRLQLLTKVDLKFDTSLTGKIEGYIFVVYDPTAGPLPAGDDAAQPESGADSDTGDDTPDPGATPTPPAGEPAA